ncbi:MAG: hypothetical protein CMA21_00660 [Euryarchaeota archaeon]|nr:hypothetical protein [Euryarchaeota archaeon]
MGYIDLPWIIGGSVCIFCSHSEIAGIQLDDSPVVLIAGSIVVTACAIYNRSAKDEDSEDGDLEDNQPQESESQSSGPGNVRLKNGRSERNRELRVSSLISSISGFLLLMFFISPLMLAEGSVPELSGRANAVDYMNEGSWGNSDNDERGSLGHNQSSHGGSFAWSELNPVFGLVYAFGDINCHQKHDRSWKINENQMPVCARDVGIFMGLFMGSLFFRMRGYNRWTVRDSFLSVFDDDSIESVYLNDGRLRLMILFLALGIVPMAMDGFTQLLTVYESTNIIRVITGFMAGFVIGWFVSSALSSRPELFDSPSSVLLPANSKLTLK